jgi:hypothetical protein
MAGQLDRQRLRGNFLDRIDEVQRQAAELERAAVRLDDGGQLRLPGLLLRVLDAPPDAPPAGYVLVYAEAEAGTTYLRVLDDTGTVKTLESWV